MSLHVVCCLRDDALLQSSPVAWSQTLPTSGATTTNAVPSDGRPYALHLVAEVKMYVDIALAPNANVDTRRLLHPGAELVVSARPGERVQWVAKA